MIVCDCTGARTSAHGWRNVGANGEQWVVCSTCGRPTERWLRAQGDDVINYFSGGPLDGHAYTTASLLSRGAMQLPITDYRWTPDTITSPNTGAVARVWKHKDFLDVQGAAAEGTGDRKDATSVGNEAPQPHTESGGTSQMSNVTESSTDLKARREALKVSRPQFAEQLGSTPSKVYRIETGGKRTTDEERASYVKLLEALEGGNANASDETTAEAGDAGEASDVPEVPGGGDVVATESDPQ